MAHAKKKPKHKPTASEKRERRNYHILDLYRAGNTMAKIGTTVNASESTISRVVARLS